MIDYSQSGEQALILEHFGDRVGTFLDIGAADGEHFSNTRALAKLGWDGVLVEPSPKQFLGLLELYRNDPKYTLINGAIAAARLQKFMHARDSVVSTLRPEFYEDWKNSGRYEEFLIPTFEPRSLPYWSREAKFISVDAEGMSDEIVSWLLWEPYLRCELVCYEAGPTKFNAERELKYHGFEFWKATANNHLWRRQA